MVNNGLENQKIKEFLYKYKHYNGDEKTLTYPIRIPYKGNLNELAHEIVAFKMDMIMKMLDAHIELLHQLKTFIDHENQLYYSNNDKDLIQRGRNGQIDIDTVIRSLEKQYKTEVLEFAERIGYSDEEIFAQSFHCLVHSPLLPEILTKEKHYAKIICNMNNRMEKEIDTLTNSHQKELDDKIQQLDVSITTKDINNLLSRQHTTQSLVLKKWESETEAIKGHQKNEYKDWITTQVAKTFDTPGSSMPNLSRTTNFLSSTPSIEESFTIHLGSQLKHMHNIRILSADINDLCSPLYDTDESLIGLNTALELYSSSLSGVVVLTPSGAIQPNNIIFKNAHMSTEFHFDQVNNQIDKINYLKTKVSQNQQQNNGGGNTTPTSTNSSNSSNSGSGGSTPKNKNGKFKPGDFFITRHSNLSQVHIIFHLISDESFESPDEINSRHPVILGLRNILKTASKYDITTLTIPALLRHEMSEDMTVSWCIRRAELIFKCAKGFMIESASWGGAELSTLQLLLPCDISSELFAVLVGMVPHIFRVANPKILQETLK